MGVGQRSKSFRGNPRWMRGLHIQTGTLFITGDADRYGIRFLGVLGTSFLTVYGFAWTLGLRQAEAEPGTPPQVMGHGNDFIAVNEAQQYDNGHGS